MAKLVKAGLQNTVGQPNIKQYNYTNQKANAANLKIANIASATNNTFKPTSYQDKIDYSQKIINTQLHDVLAPQEGNVSSILGKYHIFDDVIIGPDTPINAESIYNALNEPKPEYQDEDGTYWMDSTGRRRYHDDEGDYIVTTDGRHVYIDNGSKSTRYYVLDEDGNREYIADWRNAHQVFEDKYPGGTSGPVSDVSALTNGTLFNPANQGHAVFPEYDLNSSQDYYHYYKDEDGTYWTTSHGDRHYHDENGNYIVTTDGRHVYMDHSSKSTKYYVLDEDGNREYIADWLNADQVFENKYPGTYPEPVSVSEALANGTLFNPVEHGTVTPVNISNVGETNTESNYSFNTSFNHVIQPGIENIINADSLNGVYKPSDHLSTRE